MIIMSTSEEWVKIYVDNSRPYYWNRRTQKIKNEEVQTSWAGKKDTSSGYFYFWRVNCPEQSVWQLPPLEEIPQAAIECDMPRFSDPGLDESLEPAGCWVKVVDATRIYLWNFKLCISTAQLPPGGVIHWTAFRSVDGSQWFYQDVNSRITSWELPCRRHVEPSQELKEAISQQGDRWLELGAPVCLTGLTKQARFNSQVGVIVDAVSERLLVRLAEDLSGIVVAVRPENIEPLPAGTLVELVGLNNHSEMNGKVGTVQRSRQSGKAEIMRYEVKIADGTEKSMKAINLKPRIRLWNLGSVLTTDKKHHTTLQWRDESSCVFVDSCGYHRGFSLHLPPGFHSELARLPSGAQEEPNRWPLIIYMHGSGGSTFFNHNKKSIRTAGMQYAACNFVVITPICKWSWKESPGEWVLDLVQALRPLVWIDYRKIYLTGYSMGGMSTWELGAMKPHLFAALCTVAGHHKREKTEWIAQRLMSTPVRCVHDRGDGTCPMHLQEMIWKLFRENDHPDFSTVLTNTADHFRVHEEAYCANEDLYRWFLQRTCGMHTVGTVDASETIKPPPAG
jgi:pimeloyl-ACP methyl ester carboxylesterase